MNTYCSGATRVNSCKPLYTSMDKYITTDGTDSGVSMHQHLPRLKSIYHRLSRKIAACINLFRHILTLHFAELLYYYSYSKCTSRSNGQFGHPVKRVKAVIVFLGEDVVT